MKFKMNNEEWEIKKISNAEMNIMMPSDKKESFTHGSTQYDELTIYLNEDAKSIRKTLIHELTHCFMYEFGHNQWEKEYNNEDVCEIVTSSYDIIHKIVEDYFGENKITIETNVIIDDRKVMEALKRNEETLSR